VFAHIAQLVEHFLGKEEVTGSNPVMGSSLFNWFLPTGLPVERLDDFCYLN
jgi:hypothetical protein